MNWQTANLPALKSVMARVRIKWKAVAGVISLLSLLIIIHQITHDNSGHCVEDEFSFNSPDVSKLRDYCNFYQLPVNGQEGDIPSSDGVTFSLQSVHVVIRHGDRSPLNSLPGIRNDRFTCTLTSNLRKSLLQADNYSKDMVARGKRSAKMTYAGVEMYPHNETCDIGSLTAHGALQHLKLGSFLREKYVIKHQLLSNANDFKGQILVRGTKLHRTLQSAVALMYGLEPQLDMSTFDGVQEADNNTMCNSHTGHQCQCDIVSAQYLDTFAPTFGQVSPMIRSLPGTERVAARLGLTVAKLPRLSHIYDVAMTHFCHYSTPQCLGTPLAQDIFSVLDESGKRASLDLQYMHLSRLKLQPLLYEIAHRMNSSRSERFVLYSGHDTSIEPLQSALGISKGVWPRYASRVIFELLVSSNRQYYIRILDNGNDVTGSTTICKGKISEVTHGLCPLERFVEFVQQAEFDGSPGKSGYANKCKNVRNV